MPAIPNKTTLENIVGHPVSPDDSENVVDYLLACLTHVTNARPLFGVFCTKSDHLEWTAGGADFHNVLKLNCADDSAEGCVTLFSQLLSSFGVGQKDYEHIIEDAGNLAPGTAMTVLKPLSSGKGKCFRLLMLRRPAPNAHQIQFSIKDVSPFQETARRTRAMAKSLVKDIGRPQNGPSARALLEGVVADLPRLFALNNDPAIKTLSQDMSKRITAASDIMVSILRTFEVEGEKNQWQPVDLNPTLRPLIQVHNEPVSDWRELRASVLRTVDGVPSLDPSIVEQVTLAHGFVSHAASTMLISPAADSFFALNGAAAGKRFSNPEDLVRAIGVEENSTRTALEFFANISHEPALGVFAVGDKNVEAWGRPGLYGGWQAMLVPNLDQGMTGGVDVRGLFHGLKNLLLHLQVLYVVDSRADVEQVQKGLSETAEKIMSRLRDLDAVAQTGQRLQNHVEESVRQWLMAAKRVGEDLDGDVVVTCNGVDSTIFTSAPSGMEDTFEELVRNAFQHGAKKVNIEAMGRGSHLSMHVTDDGPGMTKAKLAQVQRMLKKRVYDPSLSTRKNGTGNGLLAAANTVSRFVDGQLTVEPRQEGHGTKIGISMKLPRPPS